MKRALDIGLHPGIAMNYLWDLERITPSISSLICKMRKVALILTEYLSGNVSNALFTDDFKVTNNTTTWLSFPKILTITASVIIKLLYYI